MGVLLLITRRACCWTLFGLAIAVGVSCTPTPDCPAPSAPDEERRERLVEMLRSTPAAAHLVEHMPRVCFVAGRESVLTSNGVALLDSSTSDPAAAARLAHLAEHFRSRIVPPERGPRCLAHVEQNMRSEGRAWAIELELQRALGATERWTQEQAVERMMRLRADYERLCK